MNENLTFKKTTAKMAAARSFVRSLNILLKFVRLYGFDHSRTASQFETAWNELYTAISSGEEAGLLLGAADSQLLLNGEAVESAHAERSFAQLLSAAGLASIQFLPRVTREELARFVRAFPSGNAKASALAEQLKAALANYQGIRINEVRFVAEDASIPQGEGRLAASLAAKTFGADANQFKNWLSDPQKLLQLIAAAEGSRGGSGRVGEGSSSGGSGPAGSGTGGSGTGGSQKTGGSNRGTGPAAGTGSGGSGSGTGTSRGGPGNGGNGGPGNGPGGANSGAGSGPGGGGSGATGEKIVVGFGAGSATAVSGPSGAANTAAKSQSGAGAHAGSGSGSGSGQGSNAVAESGSSAGTEVSAYSGSAGADVLIGNVSFGGSGGADAPDGFSVGDEEIFGVLRLLSHLGQSASGGEGFGPGPFQEGLSKLPGSSRDVLQKALASLAAQAPAVDSNDPLLLRLAEHLAIRFALDRYERGEVRVNAVRQMLDRMSQEIAGLRQILGTHEDKMAQAGIVVESHADLLDRQFWAAVPETGKRAVLSSADAWCIPPRNVRQYVEELRRKDDQATANAILDNYAHAIGNADATARRRASIGLSDLADLYAGGDGRALGPAIRVAGLQLGVERESDLQGLVGAAFVRLAQEAGKQNRYRAVLQSLDSLDGVERQRPAFAQSVRPRLGLDKRLPEFVEEAIRANPRPDGLMDVLERLPRPTAEYLVNRFNRNGYRPDCERIVDVAKTIGGETMACLRETLMTGQPAEAAEMAGLLSRLDSFAIAKALGQRFREWPRMPQDRALRLIAASGAAERGWLLLSIFDYLDPTLRPLAADEIGMAGEVSAIEKMARMAAGDLPRGGGPFLRLKAIEALGRLRASQSAELLRDIVEAKKMWRWLNPGELRIAAFQALRGIVPDWAESFLSQSGLSTGDLEMAPREPSSHSPWFRQRRYARVRLLAPVPATASSGRETIVLELRGLSLSGGLAAGEKHSTPGTLVSLRIGSGLRPIRAQAFMRDARAQGLSFEFADMDLEERARLRRFLQENAASKNATRQQDGELAPVAES